MVAYYFLFILPAFGVISPIHIKKNLDSFFWFILILTYIFIIGFRYEVGGDWGTYVYTSNIMYSGGFNLFSFVLRSDYGYELINWITLNLGLGAYGINVFCSVVFTTSLFYFCSLQPNKWLGIIISFPVIIMVLGMGFTRQGVAFSFLLLSIISLTHKRPIYFFIYIFLAVLFHKSAIIFLPIYLITIEKYKIKHLIFFSLFSLFTTLIVWGDLRHLFQVYITYRDHNDEWGLKLISKGALIRLSLNIIPAILMIIFYSKITKNIIEKRIFLSFSFLSILFLFFVFEFSVVVDRIVLYISFLQIFVLTRLCYIFNNNNTVLIINIFIVFFYFIVLIVWLNFGINSHAWIPYKNMFFDG